jgi:hypothetical protein
MRSDLRYPFVDWILSTKGLRIAPRTTFRTLSKLRNSIVNTVRKKHLRCTSP